MSDIKELKAQFVGVSEFGQLIYKTPKHGYICREEHGTTWHTCEDAPYGYCEPGYPIRKDIDVIVCDKKWKPVKRKEVADATT